MITEKILGSAYWASYFINGDASGLDDEEIAAADKWFEDNEVIDVIDCADESFFSWSYGFHADPRYRGGELLEYTCVVALED